MPLTAEEIEKRDQEYHKNYYQKNKGKTKDYYLKNQAKIKKYQKDYRQQNQAKITEYQKDYRQQNPEKIKVRRTLRVFLTKLHITDRLDTLNLTLLLKETENIINHNSTDNNQLSYPLLLQSDLTKLTKLTTLLNKYIQTKEKEKDNITPIEEELTNPNNLSPNLDHTPSTLLSGLINSNDPPLDLSIKKTITNIWRPWL